MADPLPDPLIDSYYLEEWERLQDKWAEFNRQRRSFQRERQAFTDAAIRLGREVRRKMRLHGVSVSWEFNCRFTTFRFSFVFKELSVVYPPEFCLPLIRPNLHPWNRRKEIYCRAYVKAQN